MTVARYKLGHVEVAWWSGFKPLRFPASNLPWCHFLNEADWAAVTGDWQGRVQGPGHSNPQDQR
jgi:hypothetical protein